MNKKRNDSFNQLKQNPNFDLIVIGGGATGLGVALDASTRGLRVALFESHDFAGGTSSRSTKLLHGGVRYLAQGNVALVREALSERKTVMDIAPHLAQPLAFVMPAYRWWQKLWYGMGLKMYDLLSGRFTLGKTSLLDRNNTIRALPGVQQANLHGGVQYWDGQFDDARLALSIALTAENNGALVFNYAKVEALRPINSGGYCLEVSDKLTGERIQASAPCVVNAAGVWVDELRGKASANTGKPLTNPNMVSPSQGVHVVVDRSFMDSDKALLIPKTEDGRVLFAVPWLGSLILGTTDTPRNDMPREPKPFKEELDFILREASKAFSKPVTNKDVKSIWVGLRPLVKAGASGDTKSISREHTILLEQNGMITVTGGKWTTYRVMAEEVVQKAIDSNLVKTTLPCQTAFTPLVGCPLPGSQQTPITCPPGEHLFGSNAKMVNAFEGKTNLLGLGLTEAMVRYSARLEHSITVEDMLARRWRALFLDAAQAKTMANRVAEILLEETGIDPELDGFLALCDQYLDTSKAA